MTDRIIRKRNPYTAGEVYGHITLIEFSHRQNSVTWWKGHCSACGNEAVVNPNQLRTKGVTHCGCMNKNKPCTPGEKVGEITFIRLHEKRKGHYYWLCHCGHCGNEAVLEAGNVRSGHTTHCGCQSPAPFMAGERHGMLEFVEFVETRGATAYWLAKCDCGGTTVACATSMRSGGTKSCGCLKQTHGHTMGANPTTEYRTWRAVMERCLNAQGKDYQRYGAKGITVCEEWKDFATFLRDMGPKPSPQHTIDRINNDLGYFKENCRWATAKEQADNRRATMVIEYEGKIYLSAASAAKAMGKYSPNLIKCINEGRNTIAGKTFTYLGRVGDIDPEIIRKAVA